MACDLELWPKIALQVLEDDASIVEVILKVNGMVYWHEFVVNS